MGRISILFHFTIILVLIPAGLIALTSPVHPHEPENVLIVPPNSFRKLLNPEYRILMTGGVSNPCPSVLKTFETQITEISETKTHQLMEEVVAGLRYAFQTRNNWTLPVIGTGLVGINTVLMNLLEPGDSIIVGVNGYWGNAAVILATNLGAKVITLNKTAGETFTLQELTAAVEKHKPNILYLVHGESSTGVVQNLTGVGQMCRTNGCLLVVDAAATVGSSPVLVDQWLVDGAASNTQKGLGSIVGLAPVTFSPRAIDRIKRRKLPIPALGMDMNFLIQVWIVDHNPFTFSFPVQQLYALRDALSLLVKEGLQERWVRIARESGRLIRGFQRQGLQPFIKKTSLRTPSTVLINLPANVKVGDLTSYILKRYNLALGSGYYQESEPTLRIGLYTCNAVPEKVELVLRTVQEGIKHLQNKTHCDRKSPYFILNFKKYIYLNGVIFYNNVGTCPVHKIMNKNVVNTNCFEENVSTEQIGD